MERGGEEKEGPSETMRENENERGGEAKIRNRKTSSRVVSRAI